MIAPALTGYIVNRSGNFRTPFRITHFIAVAGGAAWVFGVDQPHSSRLNIRRLRALQNPSRIAIDTEHIF